MVWTNTLLGALNFVLEYYWYSPCQANVRMALAKAGVILPIGFAILSTNAVLQTAGDICPPILILYPRMILAGEIFPHDLENFPKNVTCPLT
jgi:hypothetical protein